MSQKSKEKTFEEMKEELRSEFEDLFPKDQEAIDGIRPSKSNRSAALLLWAKWELILQQALSDQKADWRKEIEGMKKQTGKFDSMNKKYNQALQEVLDLLT
ncbi:MAG: hypothetical protein AABY22_26565 [Nanoarchaeota archaeon]